MQSLLKFFPQSNIKNISLYYVLTATNNAWFIAGNWIFFWTRYMTFGQLGIMDATAFAFGLLMEIPSGAISDMIGKKKTIVSGMFLSAVGTLTMAFSVNMTMLWIAFFIAQLGWALYSGAGEAMAYDTLIDHNEDDSFDEVISTSGTVSQLSSIIATLLGGILFVIHFRLSHFAWGISYFIGFVLSFWLVEPKTDSEKFSFNLYFKQLKDGTRQLFSPFLRKYVLVIFSLLGFDYLYNWGLVKPAMATEFGFFDKEQALLFALFGIIGAIVVKFIPYLRTKFSEIQGLFFFSVLMIIGFLLAFFPLGHWGIFSMFLISISGVLSYPWISIIVNKKVSSKYRATTLSTLALITKIPYVLLAIVAGKMVEYGTLNVFSLSLGVVGLIALVVTFAKKGD
jgi:MFS family permease